MSETDRRLFRDGTIAVARKVWNGMGIDSSMPVVVSQGNHWEIVETIARCEILNVEFDTLFRDSSRAMGRFVDSIPAPRLCDDILVIADDAGGRTFVRLDHNELVDGLRMTVGTAIHRTDQYNWKTTSQALSVPLFAVESRLL